MDIIESLNDQVNHAHKCELVGLASEADAGVLTAMRTLKRLREYRNNVDIELTSEQDLDYGMVAVLLMELERLVRAK